MMKKKTENKYAILKQLGVLPLLAVLVMGLSNREVKTEFVKPVENVKLNSLNINRQKSEKTSFKDFKIVVDGKEISTDESEFKNIKLTEENNYNDRIVVEIVEALNINSDNIRLSKSSMNSENPFLYIRTKDYVEGSNPEFDNEMALPDVQSFLYTSKNELKGEKIVKGKVTNEKGEPLESASVIIKGKTIGTITDKTGNYELNLQNANETLVFAIAGYEKQEIKVGDKGEINVKLKTEANTKPKEIEVVGYGSNESQQPQSGGFIISGGMNGTMQKGSENVTITPSAQNGLTIRATGGLTGQPIYFVDGVETTFLNELSQDSIESISVLKDKSATALYGEKGKNGVILITTKKYGQNNKSGNVTIGYGNNAALLGNPAPFGSAIGKTNQPLILVNGKESGQTLNNIDPATIESVTVLKDETATKKYGEKGKNGVIEIISKAKYTSCDDEHSFFMSVENSNDLDLRRKIAQTIKYPVVAQENNQQGVVDIWAFIEKDGTISKISEKRLDGNFINIDEVVVTSLKSETSVNSEKSNNLDLLVKESKRVIEQLSPLKIPELAGETVSFRIKFVLQ